MVATKANTVLVLLV